MALVGVFCAGGILIQIALLICSYTIAKRSIGGLTQLEHELFGLAKKIEGLTAPKRELLVKEFDQLLEKLAQDLPQAVTNTTSERIVEAERRILQRLAEIGPALSKDEEGKRKMEEFIVSLEKLEESVIDSTNEVVQRVMLNSRRELIASDQGEVQ